MFNQRPSLLSVIIPITDLENRIEFLRKWVGLVPPEIELVMVYDLNPCDNGSALFEEVTSIHENTIFTHGHFDGPGTARNVGLTLATAPFVSFWDSDDIPDLSSQLRMLNLILNSNCDVIIGGYSRRNLVTGLVKIKSPRPKTWETDVALEVGIWRMLFRKSFLQGVKFPDLRLAEDQVFFLRALESSPRVCTFSESVYVYTCNSGIQLTSERNIRIVDLKLALESYPWKNTTNSQAFKSLIRMMHAKLLISYCRRVKFWQIPIHLPTISSHFLSLIFFEKLKAREFLTILLALVKGLI